MIITAYITYTIFNASLKHITNTDVYILHVGNYYDEKKTNDIKLQPFSRLESS